MKLVVAGVIKKTENEKDTYLLVSSKKDFGEFSGFYYPPGGHVEKNENEFVALKREIKEEVGLEILSAKKVAETSGDVSDQTTCWYICDVNSYNLKVNSDELKDADFFTKEEILKMNVWPATLKFFKKYIF